jgi:hypothetical protein
MVEILYNGFDDIEAPPYDEMLCSVMISSDDEMSCDIIYSVIKDVFQNNKLIFKASGLPHNIEDVMSTIKDCNPKYFEGDSQKFYVRKYPEIHVEISETSTLKNILNDWVSIATEQRIIYVLKEHHTVDSVFNTLEENVYKKSEPLSLLWKHLNCMVKSATENEDHNTFILIFRSEFFDKINSLLRDH